MGNYLCNSCPPPAYPIIRYQAVAVRPREESEEEALQRGWQSARSSSDDELLCVGSESENEFVIYKLDEEKHVRNDFTNLASTAVNGSNFNEVENLQSPVPVHIRQKIAKETRNGNFRSKTQTIQPQGVTAFERICFDIRQSSENVNNITVAAHNQGEFSGSCQESTRGQNRGKADKNQHGEDNSETLAFDRLVLRINPPGTTPFTSPSDYFNDKQRVSETVSATPQTQLLQSIGGTHPLGSHEHHFANLIVNPMAETDPAISMYGGAIRERVSLSPDMLTADSPPTASIELEWDKEPGMSHYRPEKTLPSASHTVDSSMGGLSSSRLRSLCSTPASLEWDFKESTTSLMEVPLGADEEEAWGASDTEELLQEIELLASRALQDEASYEDAAQRPLHDR